VTADILVITRDHIGERMASPGIRMYNIARVLAKRLPDRKVTLALPPDSVLPGALPFDIVPYERSAVLAAARRSAVLISNYYPPYLYPLMARKRVILDLFSPFTERLEVAHSKGRASDAYFASYGRELVAQMLLSDLVLCATNRQRDLYFGMLAALGRVDPDIYDKDHWLSKMIVLAPFGVRDGEPKATKRVLRGVWPGIAERDTILIWNGVIIDWYDLETLISAIGNISHHRSDIKLFFLGTEHPDNPNVPKLQGLGGGTVRAALRQCEELGLLDRQVFFNFDWVDYDGTANFLSEADIGVCTYFNNVETRFAFRSRYLDLLWAELPILCTQGDVWAEMVAAKPLGVAVPERDEPALRTAIERLADDTPFVIECKRNLQEERERFRWERVLERLVCYCQDMPASQTKLPQLPAVGALLASNQLTRLQEAALVRLAPAYRRARGAARQVRAATRAARPSLEGSP
jgi:glycosyltransferase involved in cell wall biosynthesis